MVDVFVQLVPVTALALWVKVALAVLEVADVPVTLRVILSPVVAVVPMLVVEAVPPAPPAEGAVYLMYVPSVATTSAVMSLLKVSSQPCSV